MRYFSVILAAVGVLAFATTAGAQSFQDKAQVTIGGAESVITGFVTKVEPDAYWVRKTSGDEIKLAVTDATHMVCKTLPGAKKEGKVETKPGTGFRIGDCPFHVGEPVKAEISDLGSVTFMRYLEGTPTLKTAELGLPREWEGGALAVPQGALTLSEGPQVPVRTTEGKAFGVLVASVLDTDLGTAYGIVVRNEDQHYFPVPWGKMKMTTADGKRVAVIQGTSEEIALMFPPLYESMNRISMPALREYWEKEARPEPTRKREVDVEVVMKDKSFQVISGQSERGFLLVAGMEADIRLRNEDLVAHEFVSPLLYNVPFRISGTATLVKLSKATGVRIDPGQTVILSFQVPADLKEFDTLYDVFWCNVHGKQHGDKMRGEIVIAETRGEIGGG